MRCFGSWKYLLGKQENQSSDPLSLNIRGVCWYTCNSSSRRQGGWSLEEAGCLDINGSSVGEKIPDVNLWPHMSICTHTCVPMCTGIDRLPGTHTLHTCKKKQRRRGAKERPAPNPTSLQGLSPPLEMNCLLLRLAKPTITLTSIISKLLLWPFLCLLERWASGFWDDSSLNKLALQGWLWAVNKDANGCFEGRTQGLGI